MPIGCSIQLPDKLGHNHQESRTPAIMEQRSSGRYARCSIKSLPILWREIRVHLLIHPSEYKVYIFFS